MVTQNAMETKTSEERSSAHLLSVFIWRLLSGSVDASAYLNLSARPVEIHTNALISLHVVLTVPQSKILRLTRNQAYLACCVYEDHSTTVGAMGIEGNKAFAP